MTMLVEEKHGLKRKDQIKASHMHQPESSSSKIRHLIKCLCFSALTTLVPIALINCYFFFVYSSFIRDEALLYSLHSASLGANVSTERPTTSPQDCDIAKGRWVPDSQPPLYTNETCQYIQGHQNCMKNGRPDRGFLNWRWQSDACDLPIFEPSLFLDLMRDKKMVFFGDSIARNHMQSLLCAISQVEKPQNLYRDPIDKDVKWLFPSYNFTLTIFWSPYLVKHTPVKENDTTLIHIHLDSPEEVWNSCLAEYDVAILSTGPWYFKASIYYLNNQVIGCHHCNKNMTKVSFIDAYRTALQNVLDSMSKHEGYKGITILRTFSVEHFEGGEWWNGGHCNRTQPFSQDDGFELPWMSSEMHRIQIDEFKRSASSTQNQNGSKLKLLDVTYSAWLRPDGHPDVYRSSQPDRKNGAPVQSDCLHWCLPGPIDMWNQAVLSMLKGEKQS